MADQITLVTDDFTGPSVPENFLRNLQTYDPSLLVRWNHKKMRFVIEQCTRHYAQGVGHNHLCERIYVMLVQDPDGCMMSLGDAVIEQIKKRDVTKQGYGPEGLARWTADRAREDAEVRADIERKQDDAIKHCSRFSRRQLLDAFTRLENCGTPNR